MPLCHLVKIVKRKIKKKKENMILLPEKKKVLLARFALMQYKSTDIIIRWSTIVKTMNCEIK